MMPCIQACRSDLALPSRYHLVKSCLQQFLLGHILPSSTKSNRAEMIENTKNIVSAIIFYPALLFSEITPCFHCSTNNLMRPIIDNPRKNRPFSFFLLRMIVPCLKGSHQGHFKKAHKYLFVQHLRLATRSYLCLI